MSLHVTTLRCEPCMYCCLAVTFTCTLPHNVCWSLQLTDVPSHFRSAFLPPSFMQTQLKCRGRSRYVVHLYALTSPKQTGNHIIYVTRGPWFTALDASMTHDLCLDLLPTALSASFYRSMRRCELEKALSHLAPCAAVYSLPPAVGRTLEWKWAGDNCGYLHWTGTTSTRVLRTSNHRTIAIGLVCLKCDISCATFVLTEIQKNVTLILKNIFQFVSPPNFNRVPIPELYGHAVFRDFRYCAETADVVPKIFWNTHQESKLNVTFSPCQQIISFSRQLRLMLGNRFTFFLKVPNRHQGIGKRRNPGLYSLSWK